MTQPRHGDPSYPVMGETDATSGELMSAIRTHFPLLPEQEVRDVVEKLRGLNDMYGELIQ